MTVVGKLTANQYFHRRVDVELPMQSHLKKPLRRKNCEGRFLQRASTADTSSNYVGDDEASRSSCGGVGRWRTSFVVGNGGHLLFLCKASEPYAYSKRNIHV